VRESVAGILGGALSTPLLEMSAAQISQCLARHQEGRNIAQAVRRWLLTEEPDARSRVTSSEDHRRGSDAETGFLPKSICYRPDSSAGIATRLRAGRPRYWGETRDFSLLHNVHEYGRDVSPGIHRSEHGADHSPLSSAEVKYGGVKPPLPHTFSCFDV
jgi:hypothetical protein